MQNKLIVIEGLDGAGKSTQLSLIRKFFNLNNIKFKDVHFPKLNDGYFGELIAEYLRGEYGTIESVDPKLVALLFACDRKEHIKQINSWLEKGYVVFADRYVNSNIAFQCAKYDNLNKKENLKNWILDFEYNFNGLPKPVISLYLDVPFNQIQKSLESKRTGSDRDYLNGKRDIHESSLKLQERVRVEYLKMVKEQKDFYKIKCSDDENNFLPPEQVHIQILDFLVKSNIISNGFIKVLSQ